MHAVQTPADHWLLACECFCMGFAVDRGLLQPLWSENDLVPAPPVYDDGMVVDSELVKASAATRRILADKLENEDANPETIAD